VGSMRGASLPRRSWYGIAGAALLIASGALHLDLYLTGYNSIPTIGPLFLLQIIAAFLLAAAIPLTGLRLAYLAGAGFAVATGGGGGGQTLDARTIGGKTLLTDAKGLTLYTFAPDKVNKSVCYGDCASYWPPVPGNVSAGPGVTGKIGTITRTDGTTQATYNGHPLYTYIGDHGPGTAAGNNINLNGGLWLEVPVSSG